MKRLCTGKRSRVSAFGVFAFAALLDLMAMPAYSSQQVATLTEFTGMVIVQSQGDWGVKSEKGLPLYSMDKVVTKTGTAVVTFKDGAVLQIRANSNLLIEEQEKTGSITRNLRLLLGKVLFKTGVGSEAQTNLQTPTAVVGLRGTAGTLSIGLDGKAYIQFTEGGASYTLGDFLSGVAKDVPPELANLNPAQLAAFAAAAAADQAKNAAQAAKEGKITDPQAALAAEKAAEATAVEAKTAAEAMLYNPDAAIRQQVQEAIDAATKAIEAAKKAQEEAIRNGANPEGPLSYNPISEERPITFDVKPPITPEPNVEIPFTTFVTPASPASTDNGSGSVTPGGFLDTGTLSTSFDPNTNTGTITLSGRYSQPVQNPGGASAGGNLGDGSAYSGFVGGVIGSWQGLVAGVFVNSNGGAGFVAGTLDGDYNAETGDLNASGPIVRTLVLGATSLTPDQLSAALEDPANQALFNDLPVPVIGNLITGGPVQNGEAASSSIKGIPTLDGGLLGVWDAGIQGYSYNNPDAKTQWSAVYADNKAGYYSIGQLAATDDLQGHLGLGGELSFISRRHIGKVGLEYRATYDTASRILQGISAGTYLAKPLKYVSDVVQTGKMTGLLGGTESLWSGSLQSPASFTFMGSIYSVSDKVLDIHATDGGWNGGYWTTLFPGGTTHVSSLSNENWIVDPTHPIVSGLTNSDYLNWGATSHAYFTNLPENATTIMTDQYNNPTVIEYAYNGGKVLGSTQTLEWALKNNYAKGGLPLKNTLSYAAAGGTKVLLIQDVLPWEYDSNRIAMDSLGIPYDVCTSSEFAGIDLSPYSIIVISSDQTNQYYDNMAANISKLEGFLDGGVADNHDTWHSTIFSHNYDNGTDTTYDGGAYYGVIGGNRIAGKLQGDMFLIYADPAGNVGIVVGDNSSLIYADFNMFSGDGNAFPIQLLGGLGIQPENLKASIVTVPINLGGGGFPGEFVQENPNFYITSSDGGFSSIQDQDWGIWSNALAGNYTGDPTDAWSAMLNSESPQFSMWNSVDGSKWSEREISGKVSGGWVNWDKAVTGVAGGQLKGTFNPLDTTWQAFASGAFLGTNQFMDMVSKGRLEDLQKLNIPCMQVGKATLTGSSDFLNVSMNDVTFFAYSTGANPRIWATSSVNGTYTGIPSANHNVSLSGGGLNADFTVNNWANNKWGAHVAGAGPLNRTDVGGTVNVNFQGAAAGKYKGTTSGNFSGTGAGKAR